MRGELLFPAVFAAFIGAAIMFYGSGYDPERLGEYPPRPKQIATKASLLVGAALLGLPSLYFRIDFHRSDVWEIAILACIGWFALWCAGHIGALFGFVRFVAAERWRSKEAQEQAITKILTPDSSSRNTGSIS